MTGHHSTGEDSGSSVFEARASEGSRTSFRHIWDRTNSSDSISMSEGRPSIEDLQSLTANTKDGFFQTVGQAKAGPSFR